MQMAAYYSNNVTTDHIQQVLFLRYFKFRFCVELFQHLSYIRASVDYQGGGAQIQYLSCAQYLDENKSLILKIVESQSAGKLSECAENQARLQRNLMYLAAIADSQPQPTAQNPTTGMYTQQQQAAQSHALMAAGRTSMLYSQQPYEALQQQSMHSSLGMSSGLNNILRGEPNGAGGSSVSFSDLGH